MLDSWYHILVDALDPFFWGGELIGEENLPSEGPAIFIANHLDATGPIACCCSLPMRLYPWSVADMMDPLKAPDYLNQDFTERFLHLKPPFSLLISRLLARITVPMLRGLGCIPVYKGDYDGMQETISLSMQLLQRGRYLLIFPEDPTMEAEVVTGIKPFLHTFARLGEVFFINTGKRLAFYPLAIHPKGRIQVGEPVLFNPTIKPGEERYRIKALLEIMILRMYLALGGEQYDKSTLCPERK